ncbi:MAG: NifB/NifX family molybdenum-iron cluster-binding protein [Phycisphaerae bacterium]
MKVAIPHWQGRISPVFDVAGRVLLVDVVDGAALSRRDVALESEDPQQRAADLANLGGELLICGAISRQMEMALSAVGIEVIPQTCGEVEEVLVAFTQGRLPQEAFLMPGCCRRRRQLCTGRRRRRRQGRP